MPDVRESITIEELIGMLIVPGFSGCCTLLPERGWTCPLGTPLCERGEAARQGPLISLISKLVDFELARSYMQLRSAPVGSFQFSNQPRSQTEGKKPVEISIRI
jgi:hypothetical protein